MPSGKPRGFVGVKELTHGGDALSITARLLRGRERIEVTPSGESPIIIKVPDGEKITLYFPSVEGDTMIVSTERYRKTKETTRFYHNRTGRELSKDELETRPVSTFRLE